jgi:hypothetical protein
MSAHAWRVDKVVRTRDGSVIGIEVGKPILSYDKAREDFDATFTALGPGHSVRLLRANFDLSTMTFDWLMMREGWAGR